MIDPVKRAYRNHLLEILAALVKARVEFIVCGGVAAVLHGVERMTMDLDVSVNLTAKNLDRFVGVLQKLGLRPRVPVELSR